MNSWDGLQCREIRRSSPWMGRRDQRRDSPELGADARPANSREATASASGPVRAEGEPHPVLASLPDFLWTSWDLIPMES